MLVVMWLIMVMVVMIMMMVFMVMVVVVVMGMIFFFWSFIINGTLDPSKDQEDMNKSYSQKILIEEISKYLPT